MKALVAIFIALAVFLTACTAAPRPPLDPTAARASVVELTYSVQATAEQCSANARHLARIDALRSEAMFDACVKALIPARDAVIFALPDVEPWSPRSAAAIGCAAKTVRLGIEGVRAAFSEQGYTGPIPALMQDGIIIGQRLEPWADASCDPLHPTSRTSTFVDPNIARVEPDYPAPVQP